MHLVESTGVDAGIVDGLARLHPDGGVVDQDVQTAESGHDVVDQLGSQRRVRLVGPESGRLHPLVLQFLDYLRGLVGRGDVGDRDIRARVGQGMGGGRTQPSGTTGDEGDFVL